MTFDQSGFDVRCDWGENSVRHLAYGVDAVIIVDVLSFSTCVEIGANNSAFDLNVQVESTTGSAGITGKSKIKHPRDPRAPRGLLFLNAQVKNAIIENQQACSCHKQFTLR